MLNECGRSLVAVGALGTTDVLRVANSPTGIKAWERACDEGESADCANTRKERERAITNRSEPFSYPPLATVIDHG
jgi:hypothetical protein